MSLLFVRDVQNLLALVVIYGDGVQHLILPNNQGVILSFSQRVHMYLYLYPFGIGCRLLPQHVRQHPAVASALTVYWMWP